MDSISGQQVRDSCLNETELILEDYRRNLTKTLHNKVLTYTKKVINNEFLLNPNRAKTQGSTSYYLNSSREITLVEIFKYSLKESVIHFCLDFMTKEINDSKKIMQEILCLWKTDLRKYYLKGELTFWEIACLIVNYCCLFTLNITKTNSGTNPFQVYSEFQKLNELTVYETENWVKQNDICDEQEIQSVHQQYFKERIEKLVLLSKRDSAVITLLISTMCYQQRCQERVLNMSEVHQQIVKKSIKQAYKKKRAIIQSTNFLCERLEKHIIPMLLIDSFEKINLFIKTNDQTKQIGNMRPMLSNKQFFEQQQRLYEQHQFDWRELQRSTV